MRPSRGPRLVGFAVGLFASPFVATALLPDPRVAHTSGNAHRADPPRPGVRLLGEGEDLSGGGSAAPHTFPLEAGPPVPVLATLVQTHSAERLILDFAEPAARRFDALLSDRLTGAATSLSPELLVLLRSLGAEFPACHVELVSGYRSPKLNEMLRKKGHHVASKSQHSLGHAVDFRLVPDGEDLPLAPAGLAARIRAGGWRGGLGIYPGKDDRFVHADVGPERTWVDGRAARKAR